MNNDQEFKEFILKERGEDALELYLKYPRLYPIVDTYVDEGITIEDIDKWYNNIFSSMDKIDFQNMLYSLIFICNNVESLESKDEFRSKYLHLSKLGVKEIMNNLNFYLNHIILPVRIRFNIMKYGWNGKYKQYLYSN